MTRAKSAIQYDGEKLEYIVVVIFCNRQVDLMHVYNVRTTSLTFNTGSPEVAIITRRGGGGCHRLISVDQGTSSSKWTISPSSR